MAADEIEINALYQAARRVTRVHTFQVKQHIGSIVLEHLSNKFDIHVLNIDLLVQNGTCISARLQQRRHSGSETLYHTCRFLFKIMTASLSFS